MDKLTVRGGGRGIVLGRREPASITGESCLGSGLGKVRCTDFVLSDAAGFENETNQATAKHGQPSRLLGS